MTRGRLLTAVALAAIAAAVAVVVAFVQVHAVLYEPWRAWSGTERIVDIPPSSDAGEAIRLLAEAGAIRYPWLAERWVIARGWDRELRAGEYRLERAMSVAELVAMLRAGSVVLHSVTIPEGLTLDATAERVAAAGFGTAEGARAAFRDPAPVRDLDPAATDLEGYLFPDTYRFARGTDPGTVARALVRRFREVVGSEFAGRAAAAGLTVREAVTLASLVEAETGLPEERPRVSRVFLNRLRKGMRLQCDPTVLYALRREGRVVERLLRGHLAHPSPWNTYRERGLPPGPICSPGGSSLEAALRPATGEELYFVAAPGGGHRFSRDLGAHNRAVAEWRRYVRSSR